MPERWMPLWVGRRVRRGRVSVALSTTEQSILSPSPWRVGLVITPPTSGVVTVYPHPTGTQYEGIVLNPMSGPLSLNIYEHGDLTTRGWFCVWTDHNGEWWDKPISRFRQIGSTTGVDMVITVAAQTDRVHVLEGVSFSYDNTTSVGGANIQDGATQITAWIFSGSKDIPITRPLPMTRGNLLRLTVGNVGAGVAIQGHVLGYTLPAATMQVYETILEGG